MISLVLKQCPVFAEAPEFSKQTIEENIIAIFDKRLREILWFDHVLRITTTTVPYSLSRERYTCIELKLDESFTLDATQPE